MNDTPVITAAPETITAGTVQPTPEGQPTPQQQQPGGFGMMVPMLLLLAIFYFMMIKPQQRKEKERRKMIDELRAGARIVFAGGLTGRIVEAKTQLFRVEIAPGTVIEIARDSVQSILTEETPAEK